MQYLVVTKDNGSVDWSNKHIVLRKEALYVWDMYKKGIVRNIWFTDITKDAVLIVEVENEGDVENFVKNLPLVKENLITCSITGLTSYTGFERLFKETT